MKTIFCLALLTSTAWLLTGCVATTTVGYDEPVYYHRPYHEVYVYRTRPVYYHKTVYREGRPHGHHHDNHHDEDHRH